MRPTLRTFNKSSMRLSSGGDTLRQRTIPNRSTPISSRRMRTLERPNAQRHHDCPKDPSKLQFARKASDTGSAVEGLHRNARPARSVDPSPTESHRGGAWPELAEKKETNQCQAGNGQSPSRQEVVDTAHESLGQQASFMITLFVIVGAVTAVLATRGGRDLHPLHRCAPSVVSLKS